MKVLIMNGAAESGKGAVVKYIEEIFGIKIVSYSSIDYIKEVAKDKFGWNGRKDPKDRILLATIKQALIAYNDLPTKKVIHKIEECVIFKEDLLVVDIREPDEIEKLVNHCSKIKIVCHTCRVYNVEAEYNAQKNELNLTGDRLYGKYDYDINIYNNGTLEDLRERVILFFGNLYKKD